MEETYVIKPFDEEEFERMSIKEQKEYYEKQIALNRKNRMRLAVKMGEYLYRYNKRIQEDEEIMEKEMDEFRNHRKRDRSCSRSRSRSPKRIRSRSPSRSRSHSPSRSRSPSPRSLSRSRSRSRSPTPPSQQQQQQITVSFNEDSIIPLRRSPPIGQRSDYFPDDDIRREEQNYNNYRSDIYSTDKQHHFRPYRKGRNFRQRR